MAKKNKQAKKSGIGFKWIFLSVFFLAFMIMFMPTTFLLAVGLLPTFVAIAVDREPGRNKSFTIGAMNFSGCFPYLLGLWTKSNSMDQVMGYIADPKTIIVMYSAAGIGYLINWLVTMGVSSILVQRSRMRIKKIEEEKKALEERWGKHVNGSYDLDDLGFIIEKPAA
ncbi:MAG TPA: hypothetical protein PLF01_01285 [Alphaproteobacteria bacterium]|nr:hypothetical protein [Alphaproteobacteria bacterium]